MSERSKNIMQWVLIVPIAFSLANNSISYLLDFSDGNLLVGVICFITILALVGVFFHKYRTLSSIVLISTRLPFLWMANNEIEALMNLTYVGILAIIFWLAHDNYISEAAHSS